MRDFTPMYRALGGSVLLCFSLLACSSDGNSTGSGGMGGDTSSGGEAAGTSTGGDAAGKGGSNAGGTSAGAGGMSGGAAGHGGAQGGEGNGGSSMVGGHCSPGQLSQASDAKAISTCPSYDPYLVVQPKGTKLWVYDVVVDKPASDMSAFSAEFSDGKHPKLEVWSSAEKCGVASQKLVTSDAGSGTACMERTDPTTAMPHLLVVLFADAPLDSVTYCATGMCP